MRHPAKLSKILGVYLTYFLFHPSLSPFIVSSSPYLLVSLLCSTQFLSCSFVDISDLIFLQFNDSPYQICKFWFRSFEVLTFLLQFLVMETFMSNTDVNLETVFGIT